MITARCSDARDRAGRVVLVGENDHYKPLAVTLRSLLAGGAIGELVFAHFMTIVKRLKTADDWRNDEDDGGRRRVLRRRHPLAALRQQPRTDHLSHPRLSAAALAQGPDTRVKSMMVAFQYDNGAVGSLYYSREIPSLFKGLASRSCSAARA